MRDDYNRIKALPRGKKHWNWTETPNKLTLHKRIHRAFGKASDRKCVDCGNQARDWSLETEKYSDDVNDYRPRCRSCHRKKDYSETLREIAKRSSENRVRNNKGQYAKR